MLTVKQQWWYRGYARLVCFFTLVFALVGFATSEGGLPKTDPLAYWLFMFVAIKVG